MPTPSRRRPRRPRRAAPGRRRRRRATTPDGATWKRSFAPFSRCAGGTPANRGDYTRASDPWVDIAPNGDVWQVSLSVNLADVTTAMLVSRSKDGGTTWSDPATLQRDTGDAFN